MIEFVADANGFKKWDSGKPDPSLIPPGAIMDVAAVLTHGAEKYGANNWHRCANSRRYVAAALRHVFAWIGGEEIDKESGLPHLAHATTCLLFLAEFPKLSKGARPFSERFGEEDASPADLMPPDVPGHAATPLEQASSDYVNTFLIPERAGGSPTFHGDGF